MYDSMLSLCEDERVPSTENVQLFLGADKSQPEQLANGQLYWWRIHDFRYSGLEERVKEKKQRLVEMKAKLGRAKCGKVVDSKRRSEGYVRLPLFGVYKRHLYSGVPDDVVYREHGNRRRGIGQCSACIAS